MGSVFLFFPLVLFIHVRLLPWQGSLVAAYVWKPQQKSVAAESVTQFQEQFHVGLNEMQSSSS